MSRVEEQSVTRTWVGTLGIVLMSIGFAAALVGVALFIFAYPERWYAIGDVSFEQSKKWVEGIVLTAWAGLLLLLPGTTLFFFGRNVEGSGRAHDRHRVEHQERI